MCHVKWHIPLANAYAPVKAYNFSQKDGHCQLLKSQFSAQIGYFIPKNPIFSVNQILGLSLIPNPPIYKPMTTSITYSDSAAMIHFAVKVN